MLRDELLQKYTETAQQLKESTGVPFHTKGGSLCLEDGHHNLTQRHPKAGSLLEAPGPQCLQPCGESDPHLTLEDTSAKKEGCETASHF